MKARQFGWLILKLATTAGLLFLLAGKIDLKAVTVELRTLRISWAAAATALLFGQLLLTAVRWHIVCRLVSAALGFGQAVRLVLIGQFFNQVLPTSVGGDAVRAWLLSREAVPLGRAVVSIVCDRVAALVVLTVIAATTIPFLAKAGLNVPALEELAFGALALTALGLLLLLLLGEELAGWLRRYRLFKSVGGLVGDLRTVLLTSSQSVLMLGLTLLVQLVMVVVVVTCAMAIGVQFGAVHVLLIPSILLISMIPISFAGWGVREGAMVVVLGLAGAPAPEALAISLLLGLAQIVIGIPGGAIWLLRRGVRNANGATTSTSPQGNSDAG